MDIIDTIRADDVAAVLQRLDVPAKVTTDGDGDPMIFFKPLGEVTCQVFFYGLTDGSAKSIQVRADFREERTPGQMNAFTRKKRFVKAYTDTDGCAALVMDIPLHGGVSTGHIKEVLWFFLAALEDFVKYLQETE